jgi:hypothetical protein
MIAPLFVVVGHVNRGKSSIVSTLAADDSVQIDAMPGTTSDCHRYRMRIGEKVLLEFVDTPGFERPRQMLSWLKEHETNTAERAQVVADFVDFHKQDDAFREECALVKPLLEGGIILYVVDASKPPSVKEEAEMEILRWTGRARMALLNPIGSADYAPEWRAILDQYFNLVRSFDAQCAGFGERMKLLAALREVSETSRTPIERAIRALREDRRANLGEAAEVLAEMLVEILTLTKQKRIAVNVDSLPYHASLSERYYNRIRDLESQAQQHLKEIFGHRGLVVEQEEISELSDDLFNLSLWNHLGLTSTQLVAAGAATGAAAGGAVDLAVGGISFGAALFTGAAAGAAASWWAGRQLPRVKVQGIPLGGQMLQIGPMKNREFPWVLLDRNLLFFDLIAQHPHARRVRVAVDSRSLVSSFSGPLRNRFERLFGQLRSAAAGERVERVKSTLADMLTDYLVKHDLGNASDAL